MLLELCLSERRSVPSFCVCSFWAFFTSFCFGTFYGAVLAVSCAQTPLIFREWYPSLILLRKSRKPLTTGRILCRLPTIPQQRCVSVAIGADFYVCFQLQIPFPLEPQYFLKFASSDFYSITAEIENSFSATRNTCAALL